MYNEIDRCPVALNSVWSKVEHHFATQKQTEVLEVKRTYVGFTTQLIS